MSGAVKFLIGLAAVLLLGWLYQGPLGQGERVIAAIEAEAQRTVTAAAVPGVTVKLRRDPAARVAVLSGPADEFQRRGQGSLKGLTQLVDEVEGVAAVQWADEPPARQFVVPLLAEGLIPLVLAYLVGLAIAWLIRRRRDAEE